MERAGFEPATFGLQSRAPAVDERARTRLNGRNHAGVRVHTRVCTAGCVAGFPTV